MTKQVGSRSIADRFRDFFKARAKRRLDEPKDLYGDTLLHRACYKDDPETVRFLMDHGADPNVANLVGTAPLHEASYRDQPDTARLLLSHGADVNAQNHQRSTPLHIACFRGYPQVVRVLLAAGADATMTDREGNTPLDDAMALSVDNPFREEILDLFRQYAPEVVMEAYCSQGPGG